MTPGQWLLQLNHFHQDRKRSRIMLERLQLTKGFFKITKFALRVQLMQKKVTYLSPLLSSGCYHNQAILLGLKYGCHWDTTAVSCFANSQIQDQKMQLNKLELDKHVCGARLQIVHQMIQIFGTISMVQKFMMHQLMVLQ